MKDLKILHLEDEEIKSHLDSEVSYEDLLKNLNDSGSAELNSNLEYLKENSFLGVCPFSGKSLKTQVSIFHSAHIFYHFENKDTKKTFWIVTGNMGMGFPKVGILFWSKDKYLFVHRYNRYSFKRENRMIISTFLKSKQKDWKGSGMKKYILSSPKKIALYLCSRHFFHYLWNELSGLHQIFERNELEKIDKIFIADGLSSYTCLRPEQFLPEAKNKMEYVSPENLFTKVQEENYFLLRFGSIEMSQNFLDRVYEQCLEKVDSRFIQEMIQFRSKYKLVMVISIRSGMNKNWVNQVNGIAKIINSLGQKYPQMGFILDGFSAVQSPINQQVIEDQKSTVQEILSSVIHREKVWSTIGIEMCETIVLSRFVDLYFTVHGSQQHKWGWFGNKPGLVHGTEKRMKDMERFSDRQPMYRMENPMICAHIPSIHIKSKGKEFQDSYEYDWNLALNRLELIINSIERQNHESWLRLKEQMNQIG